MIKKKKVLFVIIGIVLVIGLFLAVITGAAYLRKRASVQYLEKRYGLKVEFIEEKPSVWCRSDIFLKNLEEPQEIICVQVNFDGSIVKDDYGMVILEEKLAEKFNSSVTALWEKKVTTRVKLISGDSLKEILYNDKRSYYRVGIFLDSELEDRLNEEKNKINIDEVKDLIPSYTLYIDVEMKRGDIDNQQEKAKVLDLVKDIKECEYYPFGIDISYNYKDDKDIAYLSVDEVENVDTLEDIEDLRIY